MHRFLSRTVSVLLPLCLLTTASAAAQTPAFGVPSPLPSAQLPAFDDTSPPRSPRTPVYGDASPLSPDPAPDIDAGADGFVLPLASGDVAREFDGPPQPWLQGHRGVDLGATAGQQVLAPAAGTVAFAGVVAGKPVVSLNHPGGIRTTYEPVRASVRQGDPVSAGEVIGQIAAVHPGCPRERCLHWGARRSDEPDSYFDPLTLLGAQAVPIVLKPV